MALLGLLAITALVVGSAHAQRPQVTLPDLGTMEGYMGNSFISDREFYHFKGVPFAKAPIGELRFKAPQPVEPWEGILDAHSNIGHRCPQAGPAGYSGSLEGKLEQMLDIEGRAEEAEDCLFLQIYSPNIDPSANLPVVVYIHGGAFMTGSSRLFGGNKFMDHDIVLVVPHYRLGPLGFLSLHTDEIPGNAGMLDQVEALRWVQKYISYFGGDPNRVTLMGESAGAVSTSLLNLSPLSTGLFHQYITQSGTALANWAVDTDPINAAIEIGRRANCTDSEINALTDCLMTASVSDLVLAYMGYLTSEVKQGRNGIGGSAPVIQKAGSVRFLERSPKEIFSSGEYSAKPAILGGNKHEGTMPLHFIYSNILSPNDLVENEQFMSREVTRLFLDFLGIHNDQGDTLAIGVEETYLGPNKMGNFTLIMPGLIDFSSNIHIKGPTFGNAEYNAAKGAPTYLYSFHYDGSRSMFSYIAPLSPFPGGIAHGNEMILQFSMPTFTTNEQDNIVSNQFITLWVNFIKYGNPTPPENPVEGIPEWPLWTVRDGPYMVINTTSSIMHDFSKTEYFVAINEDFPNNVQ